MIEKLDQATYEEVKACQIDGVAAEDIATQLEIHIEQVQEVMRSGTWKQYRGGFTPKTTGPVVPKAVPSQQIRTLIDKDSQEYTNLSDTKDMLFMQVRALRCAVRLLEIRKRDLDDACAKYESYLHKALKMLDIDQLEEGVVDFSRPNQ